MVNPEGRMEGLVRRALEFYGVEAREIGAEQKGYRNRSFRVVTASGEELNLIFYKWEAGILERVKRADALSESVWWAGLPVRHLADERILSLGGDRIARLYHYLPGRTVAWEMFSMNHMKAMGWAMGDLHGVMAGAEVDGLTDALGELGELAERMERYFSGADVRRAMREKLGLEWKNFIKFWGSTVVEELKKLRFQPLHLDLVRGNLLFGEEKLYKVFGRVWEAGSVRLTGVIDFEKAAMGPRVVDLARSFAFLLVDVAGKSEEKIYKYLVESGYVKRGGGKVDWSGGVWEELVRFFLVYDFYKFLRHNPYEFLAENHHFVRTRDILLARGVLKLV